MSRILATEARQWMNQARDLQHTCNAIYAEMGDDLMTYAGRDTIDIAAARKAMETASICYSAALQRLDAHLRRNAFAAEAS